MQAWGKILIDNTILRGLFASAGEAKWFFLVGWRKKKSGREKGGVRRGRLVMGKEDERELAVHVVRWGGAVYERPRMMRKA